MSLVTNKNIRDDVRDTAVHTTDTLTATDVVFYLLYKKFVEDNDHIPKESRDVLYYTLSMGHNTGVIDCFDPKLALSREDFDAICEALPEGDAKFKLTRIEKFGEITIMKEDVHMLADAIVSGNFKDCFSGKARENDKYGEIRCSDEDSFKETFAEISDYILTTPQVYCLARRVTR